MNRTSAFLLGSLLLAATAVHADTLLIERVESEPELPVRGLSMGDIEARYGAP